MSSTSFYKWWARYGGIETLMMSRMKELEQKNTRLKRMYADVQLRYDILREAMAKNGKACQTFDINECCYHYKRKLSVVG